MKHQPKISVITVTYNAEDYIEATLKSVLEQTYDNLEYVIIDGESKDNTLEILQRYSDKIDVLISEPDNGLYDAMNKGKEKATGDYIIYMNAGDIFHSNNSLSEAMKGSEGSDFIYGLARRIREDSTVKPWHKKTPPAEKISARSFMNGMVVCHQCMIVRKELAPVFHNKYQISNDLDWTIRLMKEVKKVHFYDDIFCDFLDGGVSDNRRKQALWERFKICAGHFGFIPTLLEQIKIFFQFIKRGGRVS